MPPKKDAAPKSNEPSASRLAAMAWKPTPFTHINFIRGFSTMMEKQDPLKPSPSLLFDAIETGDYDKTKKILLSDGNVNATNPSGSCLAHIAVRTANYDMLELIMAFRPNVEVHERKEIGGSTPLHIASLIGNEKMCRLLLLNGASPTAKDATGSTPLHIAARNGFKDVANALVEAADKQGAALVDDKPLGEMLDGQGKSAYYWAREHGHDELAATLPPIPYNALEQMDIKKAAQHVWNPNPKKPKKDKGKKGDKDKKGGKKKK